MNDTEPPVEVIIPATGEVKAAPPHVLIVFGASGDLTTRKLLPAIAGLSDHGGLPDQFVVVGVARTQWTDDEFRKAAIEAVPDPSDRWRAMAGRFRYVAGEYASKETFDRLKQILEEVDRTAGTSGNRVYYLATVPEMFGEIATALAEHGCTKPADDSSFVRLVVEKPYGHDLASATALDAALHAALDESQIYRIDHYMGKETVQNVLALRFANAIFEPVWNRRYVDQVQITVAESLGVEHRGGFYEHAGALRDIVQNHVMQVLALTLMEPPAKVDAGGIRDEKVKLLRAVEVPSVDSAAGSAVRGQYVAGVIDGTDVPAYRHEQDVASDSQTETYVAMQLAVDNWRWAGVPVYVRTGKRLAKRVTEVALQFKRVPHLAFGGKLGRDLHPNTLVLRIQPDDGISILFGAKVPGETFQLRTVSMDFSYATAFPGEQGGGYERLLHDAMIGDPTLFIRTDEVEQAWEIVDPFLQSWRDGNVPLSRYAAGSWGPHEAELLLGRDGNQWRTP